MVTRIEQRFKEGDWIEFHCISESNKYICLSKETADILNRVATNFSGNLSFKKAEKSEVKAYCKSKIDEHQDIINYSKEQIEVYKNLLNKIE